MKIISIIKFALMLCATTLWAYSCQTDIDDGNPKIVLLNIENITENSADIVAELTTKETPLIVIFEVWDGENKVSYYSKTFPMNKTSIVKQSIKNLKRDKKYSITAIACKTTTLNGNTAFINIAETKPKDFSTIDPTILKIKKINDTFTENNLTSIEIVVEMIPKTENTKIQLQYMLNQNTITQHSDAYSGNNPVEISFKIDNLTKNTDYKIELKAINKFETKIDTLYKTAAVSDYNGNLYHVVTIGTQVWLRENFKGTHFANGDPIPNITGQAEWEAAKTPAYCYYNNDIKNAETYGALYNWYVGVDPRGLIKDFHVPSYEEWQLITNYLGGAMIAGEKMKAASPIWNGTNSSNFSALPAGGRQTHNTNEIVFMGENESVIYWSSNDFFGMSGVASVVLFRTSNTKIQHGGNFNYFGHCLRLIKN